MIVDNFDLLAWGQAIQNARENQKITREQLSEQLGITARHLQSVEKEGQHPSFDLFIRLTTMFDISADQYIFPDKKPIKSSLRRQVDTILDTFGDVELKIIEGTAQAISKVMVK